MKRTTLILAALALQLGVVGQVQADLFTYSGGIVDYTVPVTGTYDITAAGAQGGAGDTWNGGLGAQIGGDISLTAGTVLEIVVGGVGLTGNFGTVWGGGGGGGSFVFVSGA